ncbi:MAG: DUF4178 domain-containing protein [Pseudomonadota bacterium]
MSSAVQCPSCGSEHALKNPGITAIACDHCSTLFYWDAQAVHDSGKKAILDPPSSALRVGETCTLSGKDLVVLGRVRYSHRAGVWDEWFLEDDGQNIVWLTEDEKEFSLERPVPPDPSVPAFTALRVGMPLTVHGREWVIEELGKAACLGVEGQVPWVVLPEEIYPFADLSNPEGKLSLGIEYDEAGAPSLFAGQFLERDAVRVDGGPAFPEVVTAGQGVRCAGCGSPVEGRFPPDTEMLVCSSCGAGLELDQTQTRVVMQNREKPSFDLEIGHKGVLDKIAFEVVGRMRHEEMDEGLTYSSEEYLLYQERAGYRWLEKSDSGHWTLSARSHLQPGLDLFSMAPRDKVGIGDTTWEFVESGVQTLAYVDGALPWVARVGDRARYADLVAPPRSYSVEISETADGGEREMFEGRHVPVSELNAGFKTRLREGSGVAAAQPFVRTGTQTALMWLGALFAVVNLGLLGVSFTKSGRVVAKVQLGAEQYRSEWMSEPFQLKLKPSVLEISGRASVDNAWVALNFGLVNQNDEVCLETDGEASYYHGVEGGESWSEGSNSFSEYVRVDKPGTYRLLVFGTAGQGETPESAGGPSVTLVLREGVMLSRYFLIMLVLAAVYPLKEIVRRRSHDKRRIPVEDDDDDD